MTGVTKVSNRLEVVIETPKGHRNKFKFDEKTGQFRLGKVLPVGMSFPFDFGFVAGTKAEDGDPIDVLVLMDEPAFPGCIVDTRLIGVIEAEQTERGSTIRNDRLVAVSLEARDFTHVKSVADLNSNLLDELERFFVTYNETRGKRFRVLATRGPRAAQALLKRARTKANSHHQSRATQRRRKTS